MGGVGASEFVFGGPFDKPSNLTDTCDIEIDVAARSASDECNANDSDAWMLQPLDRSSCPVSIDPLENDAAVLGRCSASLVRSSSPRADR